MLPIFKIFNQFLFVNANIELNRRLSSVITRKIPLKKFNFSIRALKIYEFKEILGSWAVKEGWNPGKHEYLPFYLASLKGHKGLFLNDKIIASLSAVRYSKDFAYLGIYIVDPDYREQGLGQILAKVTLEELADCSLIGINAVQQQVRNYQRKYNFSSFHINSRWTGGFRIPNNFTLSKSEVGIKIVGKEDLDINELIDYDASIFSVSRPKFLRKWIEMPESCLLAAIKKEKICGYGVLSKCIDGYKIAPLFANDKVIAQRLYVSFSYFLQGKQNIVQLDVPENNRTAVELATQFGFYKTFETTRMYKSKEPLIEKPSNKNVYALTTLEIG